MNHNPLVSVIVPTYNSQANIERCLESIRKQTYPDIEIIVVDNHSLDNTREIAQKYSQVYIKGPERSSQRNFGASLAKGDFFLFVDSDMELTAEVVDECVREALDKNTDAIIVPELSFGEGFWTKCKALERSCYLKDSLIEAPRFFRRKAFLAVKGYDEDLIAAEDWDLSLRIKKAGFSFSRIKSLIRHNEGRLSLGNTLKKKFIYGKNIKRYLNKHPQESKKQFVIIRPSFLRNYRQLLRHPVLTLGIFIMKICEFGAGGYGMLVSKIGSGNNPDRGL